MALLAHVANERQRDKQGVFMGARSSGSWASATILFTALAGAYGAAVGDLAGGSDGAMVACGLAAMAIVLATAREVSAITASRAAAVAGIAAAIGHVSDGVTDVPAVIEGVAAATGRDIGGRCLAAALRGAVQLALPAVFLGLVLTGRSIGRFATAFLAALVPSAWWGSGLAFSSLPGSVQAAISRVTALALPTLGEPSALITWFAGAVIAVGLLVWVSFIQPNRVAFRLALWGVLAGSTAFALAEAVGLASAWLPAWLAAGPVKEWLGQPAAASIRSAVCGAVWGGILGLGAWRERTAFVSSPDVGAIRPPWEVGLLVLHAIILMAARFAPLQPNGGLLTEYAQSTLVVTAIPLACSLFGRRAPWIMLLPLAIIPMVGLTLRHAVYESGFLSSDSGWLLVAAVPVAVACAGATWIIADDEEHVGGRAGVPLGVAFLISVVTFFGLAAVMLDLAWPWSTPTPKTPALTMLMGLVSILVIPAIRMVAASAAPKISRDVANGS
jgi:hypothetical protein